MAARRTEAVLQGAVKRGVDQEGREGGREGGGSFFLLPRLFYDHSLEKVLHSTVFKVLGRTPPSKKRGREKQKRRKKERTKRLSLAKSRNSCNSCIFTRSIRHIQNIHGYSRVRSKLTGQIESGQLTRPDPRDFGTLLTRPDPIREI